MEHAHRGETALTNKDPTEALTHFTHAITAHPTSPNFHISRSTAYTRLNQHDAALNDAETAVHLAVKRGKREIIAKAQLRRGISLFNLERWGDAGYVFGVAKELDKQDKSIGIWEAKVGMKIKGLEQGDERGGVTVERMPAEKKESLKTNGSESTAATPTTTATSTTSAAPATTTPSQQTIGSSTPADKIRYEWYQTPTVISISLFAKSVPKETAEIPIQRTSLSISFPLANGSTYETTFDPLAHPIDVSQSSARVLGTKVEVTLRKAQEGVKWKDLEGAAKPSSQIDGSKDAATNGTSSGSGAATSSSASAGPAYPTSARSGPKNWDKIAQSYVKPSKPATSKPPTSSEHDHNDTTTDASTTPATTTTTTTTTNKQDDDRADDTPTEDGTYLDADEDESDTGGDQVNGLFRKLYKNASDDTKRAMMKSFTESNGTALSTNWEEVSKGKVETSPPEGMEARNWGK